MIIRSDICCFILYFRFLIVSKCEVVSPALEAEYKADVKTEESGASLKPMEVDGETKSEGTGIVLKPKQEIVSKSAAQIVNDQRAK